jgi:hypothetical protein
MSKQSLLAIANVNLFKNTNEKIEFSLSQGSRVQAQYSSYDKEKGYDVRGVTQTSSSGKNYKRLVFSTTDATGKKEYHNGALFKNEQRTTDKQPDYTGTINLDNQPQGEKLRLSAWIKNGEKSGPYLSIAIQEFQAQNQNSQNQQNAQAPSNDFDSFDNAPAAAPSYAPARPVAAAPMNRPTPTYAQAPQQRQPVAAGGFEDDSIPF